MATLSKYLRNKLVDWYKRGQSFAPPATMYYGLFTASRGARLNSTAYLQNDTLVVLIGGKYYFYKVATAGTTAATQPGTLTGTVGESITDGSAVLVEQSASLEDTSILAEVTGGSYARVAVAASLTTFSATTGAGAGAATAVSSGATAITANLAALVFPAPTADWQPSGGRIVGYACYDAATAGNLLDFGLLVTPKTVNNADPAPQFAVAALSLQLDN